MGAADIRKSHVGRMTIAQAAKLIRTLTDDEMKILLLLQSEKVQISGRLRSTSHNIAVLSFQERPNKRSTKTRFEKVEGLMTAIRPLVKSGWLRFADILNEDFGYFHLTEEGERILSLHRPIESS